MYRFLIMSIALVSLLAMGSPAMADPGDCKRGNCAAGTKSESELTDPNCRGVRASLFVLVCGGLGLLEGKAHGDAMTGLIDIFFGLGAAGSDCVDLRSIPDCPPE